MIAAIGLTTAEPQIHHNWIANWRAMLAPGRHVGQIRGVAVMVTANVGAGRMGLSTPDAVRMRVGGED